MEAARGEDRTHNLRMSLMPASLYTVYKYGALTDCATWADMFHISTSRGWFQCPWTRGVIWGGLGGRRPPPPPQVKRKKEKKKKKKKKKREKKREKREKRKKGTMNNVKLLHMKCLFFFQIFQ